MAFIPKDFFYEQHYLRKVEDKPDEPIPSNFGNDAMD